MPAYVPDVAVYAADPASPTGHEWRTSAWDDLDWWLSLDAVSDVERDAILRYVGDPAMRAKHAAKADEPAAVDEAFARSYVRSLPTSAQAAIREALAFDFEHASAQELHHATHAGFIACCDRVAAKFQYRLAT